MAQATTTPRTSTPYTTHIILALLRFGNVALEHAGNETSIGFGNHFGGS
jgi:hypothetical protein